ncbi:iron complex transport system ATP-binding protein [Desulfobaculum xiamenense]|uniref:Iron complex transport system ATP-binding protein n=1 Tax=Desulfobaculum xiamenense TaxID=995050 RepID=A0A846QPW3_9BACT|nr:ABC transporter ATP-binding protein [Desulfobaculum xiamenense]NJB68542.1 iron complex transport system ATP-binding protein [Desulfobaculum xiamenense]
MSLICESLGFAYNGRPILADISFRVERGELCAVLGRNGSGKSTLLACLCGLERPRSGRVTINGLDITRADRASVARTVSLVPQEHVDIFPFPVLDVVVMGRTAHLGLSGRPTPEDYEAAMDVLRTLNAAHLATRNFNRISGGERQTALLARALLQTREALLMDEPTNHLDFNNQHTLLARIRELCRQRGTRVVATLHDPNVARLFADHVIMLRDGHIIAQGPPSEVMTEDSVSRLYETPTRRITTAEGMELFLPEMAWEAAVGNGTRGNNAP